MFSNEVLHKGWLTLKRSSKWPLFNFFFWLSANDIKMIFCFAKYVHFNRLKLSGALKVFYFFTIFGLKNAKIKFLKKMGVLSAFIFELKYR